jgi:D-alanine-D-alanine ligase
MSELEKLIQKSDALIKEKNIYAVCNIKKCNITSNNFNKFDIRTEYLSDNEFEQIDIMLSKCAHVEKYFFDEIEFINFVCATNPDNKMMLVYNSAQSGMGIGRKSLMPAFCASKGIKITGSNSYAVSLCRHKYHAMKLLEIHGFRVPETYLYDKGWVCGQPNIGETYLLKPIFESSSIGIEKESVVIFNDKTIKFIETKQKEMNQPIIIQRFIKGYEAEVPCIALKNHIYTLNPVGITLSESEKIMGSQILDYESVYFDNYYFYNLSDIALNVQQITNDAKLVAKILGLAGLCRIDFRIDELGRHYIIDVSTNPHFINHSSVNYAFRQLSLNPDNIMKIILGSALI